MTRIEENIVNIAMMAATLLKDGRIAYSEESGHMGLTQEIIALAKQFEDEHSGVDFNSAGPDYLEEIDKFAENKLLWLHAEDPVDEPELVQVKVILRDNCIEDVRKAANAGPIDVEVIHVNRDYPDYHELDDYADEIYSNEGFVDCDFTCTHFDEK